MVVQVSCVVQQSLPSHDTETRGASKHISSQRMPTNHHAPSAWAATPAHDLTASPHMHAHHTRRLRHPTLSSSPPSTSSLAERSATHC
eukprot:scaffold36529_cov62-Phaeocystis_antarctica.AAC.6